MATTKIAIAAPVQRGGSLFTPGQFETIGRIAGTGATIEVTPFRQLYVEVPAESRELVERELKENGLEVYPSGFAVKSLIACNFCKGPEEAGLETAQALNRAIAGLETPAPLRIGYAGCGLGTSEPLLKDIGVIKIRNGFDIYVGGEPKGVKAAIAKPFLSGVEEAGLVPVIRALLDTYREQAKGRETFGKFVNRIGMEQLKARILP